MNLHLVNAAHTREAVYVADHRPGRAVLVLANGDVVDAHPADVYITAAPAL